MSYENEERRNTIYSVLFREFRRIVESIRLFEERFGNYQKLVRTLETNQTRLEDFKRECEELTQILQSHKITSASGELDLLSKIHTYIDFLHQYKQLTAPLYQQEESKVEDPNNKIQDQQPKLEYQRAMLIQQLAREKQIPEDLSILKQLKESVSRFERFQREYSDYKRYRTRVMKGGQSMSIVETRFTCQFVKKLIDDQTKLRIEQSKPLEGEDDDLYFDKEMLEGDLKELERWRTESEAVFSLLEEDDVQLSEETELRKQFENIKKQQNALPLYDREISMKMQFFEWLFASSDILNSKNEEKISIGSWDAKIKQADNFLQQVQQLLQSIHQQQNATTPSSLTYLLRNIKSHPIYQRLLWEVDQAKQVSEFVQTQKTNLKALSAKYNTTESQKLQQYNLNYFFKNKHPKSKIEKMLDQAKRSKVDLTEEIRHLSMWLKDYDMYQSQFDNGTLFTNNTFERLKEIAKALFICPVDLSDVYIKLKPSLEIAEAIKLDLKRIVQDHDLAQLQRGDGRPMKRLRFSRISPSLQIYERDCKVLGIREIDSVVDRVSKCKDRLKQITSLMDEIKEIRENVETLTIAEYESIRERIERAKRLLQEIDIDMEKRELEVRRRIFEADIRFNLFAPTDLIDASGAMIKRRRRIELDEFKLLYVKEYDILNNLLQDDEMHGKFLELKNSVNELVRRVNRVETKEELTKLEAEVVRECPLIDFSQCLTDKDAQILLGKRQQPPSRKVSSEESSSRKQSSASLGSSSEEEKTTKRQKINASGEAVTSTVKPQSSSEDEEESSSSSSSGSGSSSGSDSSSSGSEASSSEEEGSGSSSEQSEENKKETKTIAQTRSRRNITPNVDSDFVYSKSQQKTQQKMVQQSRAHPESDSEEEKTRKDRRKQEKKLERKKRELDRQLEEHRKQKKIQEGQSYQQTVNPTTQYQGIRKIFRGDPLQDASQNLGSVLKQDQDLQNSLLAFKNRIREQSRAKIMAYFNLQGSLFSSLDQDYLQNVTFDLEDELFKKHPEADHYYRKRISDVCENINLLKDYKDISELMGVKRALSFGKMLQEHHAFKDDVIKLDQKIKHRRQQLRAQGKLREQRLPSPQKDVLTKDTQVVAQQTPNETKQIETQAQALATVKTQPEEGVNTFSQQMSLGSSSESEDSNPALFSDDEQSKKCPLTTIQSILQQANKPQPAQQHRQSAQPQQQRVISSYDPTQTYTQGVYDISGGGRSMTPQANSAQDQFGFGGVRMLYNPYEVYESRHLGFGASFGLTKLAPKKPSEPILYDPSKTLKSIQRQKTIAPVGSLLKIWEGSLELAKDSYLKCKLNSNIDVQALQSLPDLPQSLQLKGKAKLQDVTQHFLRLKRDKRLIKGWVVRKNMINQENNDRYTRLFDELDQTQKSALFNVFQGVTLYIVPITKQTREFVVQMGLDVEKIKDQTIYDSSKELPADQQLKAAEEIKGLEDETHCFAFFSQIKQAFTQKSSFLNPEVLKYALPQSERPTNKTSGEALFSPITSDEEGENRHHKKSQHQQHLPMMAQVKTEEQFQPGGGLPYPQPLQPQQPSFPSSVFRGQDPRLMSSTAAYPSAATTSQQAPASHNMSLSDSHQKHRMQGFFVQNQQEEDEDEVDIDEIIRGFKNNDYNIQTIQQKLVSIIDKVKGEKEVKLTKFLQELIQSINNPKASSAASGMVKSEEKEPTAVGYSYPVGMGQNMITQQAGGYRPQFPGAIGTGNLMPTGARFPGQPLPPQNYMPYRQQYQHSNPPTPQQFQQQQGIPGIRPAQNQQAYYGQPTMPIYPPGSQQMMMQPQIRPQPGTPQQFGGQFGQPPGAQVQPGTGQIRPPPQQGYYPQGGQQQQNQYQGGNR